MEKQNHYDVIVIGGGVNGLSIAYQLAKKNVKTIVLERDRIASGASRAAAGMLGAQAEVNEKGPFFDFARESRSLFSSVIPDIETRSGVDTAYHKNGLFRLALSDKEEQKVKAMMNIHQDVGEPVEWIEPDDLIAREPHLSSDVRGAAYIPEDGQVLAKELTFAYARAAVSYGAEIKEFCDVYSLVQHGNSIKGVKTTIGEFHADHVVVASGAWSSNLPLIEDQRLQMVPVKGECISVRADQPIITGTLFSSQLYVVPKKGGRIIIGATEHEGTFDQKVTMQGMQSLTEKACRLLPAIKKVQFEDAWAGVRPQTIDGKPYMGAWPDIEGLWIAAGHYRNGILLSPLTGKFMADFITGKSVNKEWKEAFDPARLVLVKREG